MSRAILRAILTAALLIASAGEGRSQEILILGLNGDLHSLDPDSGQLSFIGLTGQHAFFWSAMAQDSQGRLFASTGDFFSGYAIHEVDPLTGQSTFLVQTNLYGLSSMAFGPGDVLYVANDRTAPASLRPMDLYTVDLGTGQETFVGDTGVNNMLAIDFDRGVLYGYPADLGLVTIDIGTGAATDVNSSFRGPNGATASMCFDDQGSLYYVDGLLWMVDSETGVFSIVDWVSGFGFWAEAVFVDGTEPKFAIWLAGTTGGPVGIRVAGATPGGQTAVVAAVGNGGPTPIAAGLPCSGTSLQLNSGMTLLQVAPADLDGKLELGPRHVAPGAVGLVRVQAIDLTTCATSNRAVVSY